MAGRRRGTVSHGTAAAPSSDTVRPHCDDVTTDAATTDEEQPYTAAAAAVIARRQKRRGRRGRPDDEDTMEEQLIGEIERRPVLYDRSVQACKKMSARDEAWREVADIIKQSGTRRVIR